MAIKVTAMFPQNSSQFRPFFLIIGLVVILGALGGCLNTTSSCHLEDLGGFGVMIEVGLRNEREIGSLRKRERWTDYEEREWRDLMHY